MKKVLSIVLILGFLFVDFLFFHDIAKPGEATSLPQFITGILTLPVMYFAFQTLFKPNHYRK